MRTFIVDAFTGRPFRGNPAGVCCVEAELQPDAMQAIAAELGASETAFIRRSGPRRFDVRFFSPKTEIPLCGHATLAAGRVALDHLGGSEVEFVTAAEHSLAVRARGAQLELTLPALQCPSTAAPDAVVRALGLRAVEHSAFNAELSILLLELPDTDTLARVAPDYRALEASHDGLMGVVATAAARDGRFDYHLRYFWPWSGTDEDPVTGGVQTFLAGYWARRLRRRRLRAFQASARTGVMELEVGDAEVRVRGEAVIVLEGRLRLSAMDFEALSEGVR